MRRNNDHVRQNLAAACASKSRGLLSLNMPSRKIEESNIRKLTKVGGASMSVTIPIHIIRELKWKEKQKVVVKKQGKKIIVQDWK